MICQGLIASAKWKLLSIWIILMIQFFAFSSIASVAELNKQTNQMKKNDVILLEQAVVRFIKEETSILTSFCPSLSKSTKASEQTLSPVTCYCKTKKRWPLEHNVAVFHHELPKLAGEWISLSPMSVFKRRFISWLVQVKITQFHKEKKNLKMNSKNILIISLFIQAGEAYKTSQFGLDCWSLTIAIIQFCLSVS